MDAMNPASTPASTIPLRIHADRDRRTLAIEWSDGHATLYDFERLRWLCPCAYCRGEAGMPGWLDSGPTLGPEQVSLVDATLVGQYAIAPSWGDGHHTGYYTFVMLREQCPCPEDTARRESAAADSGATPHATHDRP